MHRPTAWFVLALGLMLPCGLRAADAHIFVSDIVAEDFAAHVRVLASDEFGGREPGTQGEEKTLIYLRDQLQRIGLSPGNGDSYFQQVPMQLRIADLSNSQAAVSSRGRTLRFALDSQLVLGSDTGETEVSVADSPMIFAGYGIDAPEYGWDDYGAIEVAGKTVVVLAGEPTDKYEGRETFAGRRLSYYSRARYKVEEAARRGAAAAIVIHDTRDAGYDWNGVLARWHNREYSLRPADRPQPLVAIQGWISADGARSLFDAAGMDLSALRRAAARRGFGARALGDAKFNATLTGEILLGLSNNVIARIPGTTHPGEAVLYSAHWDHLGTRQHGSGDGIHNGALDNATGVAALLEIAAHFVAQERQPQRSILFLFPTLEETGLLGSSYYTAHPVVPLATTVANLNFDFLIPLGRARDFVVVGLGNSELDDVVEPVVRRMGRRLSAERAADTDGFLRSDHLSFAKVGVPVLYMRGGVEADVIGLYDPPRDESWNRIASAYHTPKDEFDPGWDLRGVVQDLQVSYEVGSILANGREWPNYHAGHTFRALRDASRTARNVCPA